MRPSPARLAAAVTAALVLVPTAAAQAPAGYYDTVDTSSAAALRASLHQVIDDHQRVPYTSGGTDTWDVLELAQEDPSNPSRVLDVFRNASYPKQGGGGANYNREHLWPNSYGFPVDTGSNYPYTDCHVLWLSDTSYNAARGNAPFDDCDAGCSEYPTLANDGQGGVGGPYPGDSNWGDGTDPSGRFEVWSGRRGDVARALLYLDVRYEGGTHGVTGDSEPDLVLTDDRALIAASVTGSNEQVAHMGLLSVLLDWHAQDPVDDFERARNDVVSSFQGNRNPFVDHPEWVGVIWQGQSLGPSLSASTAALDLVAGGTVTFDLAGGAGEAGKLYYLLGSASGTTPGVAAGVQVPLNFDSYLLLTLQNPNATIANSLAFLDGAGDGTASLTVPPAAFVHLAGAHLDHAYLVFDLPGTGAVRGVSNPVGLDLVALVGSPRLVINEIDYDQPGTDTGEFVEVLNAGTAAADLTDVVLDLYNGSGGALYASYPLAAAGASLAPGQYLVLGTSSAVAAAPAGALTLLLAAADNNVQNGAPDGMVLRDGASVLDAVSYEGAMPGLTEGAVGAPTDGGAGSIARLPDGADTDDNAADFAFTATVTPGAPNQP